MSGHKVLLVPNMTILENRNSPLILFPSAILTKVDGKETNKDLSPHGDKLSRGKKNIKFDKKKKFFDFQAQD